MTVRLLVVVGVLAAVVLVAWLRARRLAQAQGPGAGERLPPELLVPGAPRTWVLVTAPMCASCGPAEQRLRQLDPRAALVTVDAAERPDLARRLAVRAAPTLLEAEPGGRVVLRLAGTTAVNRYLASASSVA